VSGGQKLEVIGASWPAGQPTKWLVGHYFFTFPLFLLSTSPFDLPHEILKLEEHQNLKFWCRLATPLGQPPALCIPYKRASRGCLLLSPLEHLSL
jgi:hypothetical protein